jgi:hypothetical protein
MTRLTKWVAQKAGLELVDPTEDGANLFPTLRFNASIQGDAINAVNAILESLLFKRHCLWGARQMLECNQERRS